MPRKESSFLAKTGLHLPEKLYSDSTSSKDKVWIWAKVILVAILRISYFVTCNMTGTIFYFSLAILLEPFRHLNEPLYRKCIGIVFRMIQYTVGVWFETAGYKVEVHGDEIVDLEHEEVLVMSNHQSTADVMALMYTFHFTSWVSNDMLWIMDAKFKFTNFGCISLTRGDFFIREGKETRHLQDGLLRENLENVYIPLRRKWIVLFPEGGFLWKHRERGQRYSKKNGFPVLDHCLLPRVGAAQTIIDALNGQKSNARAMNRHLKWLLDVTIIYPDQKPLNLQTVILGQRDPMTIKIHFRKLPISQAPTDDSEAFRNWLFDVYKEKDKLLDLYYKKGILPMPDNNNGLCRTNPRLLKYGYIPLAAINIGGVLMTYLSYVVLCKMSSVIFDNPFYRLLLWRA